jgi:hypothetical protein
MATKASVTAAITITAPAIINRILELFADRRCCSKPVDFTGFLNEALSIVAHPSSLAWLFAYFVCTWLCPIS